MADLWRIPNLKKDTSYRRVILDTHPYTLEKIDLKSEYKIMLPMEIIELIGNAGKQTEFVQWLNDNKIK